ncbi:MAG: nucleoside triphosphate pyrophosphohydrolase [Bacteroidales bacterium]|nr:nucleoside triphosphate pyrophosphohydrolase [Bacteroidales bacterium]
MENNRIEGEWQPLEKRTEESLSRFFGILGRLRRECPWDRKQTWESLRTLTIEEVYELAQALANEDAPNVRKELGDVFLHVAFYSLIAGEKGEFDFADVVDSLCDKLVYRHPHVFGGDDSKTADEVLAKWEKLKLKEKDGNKSVLGGVPDALPALIKAYRIQGKARGVGFDWEEPRQAWQKVDEEADEFRREVERDDRDKMEAEMGDLLFSVINIARLYGINPENALERTNRKFIRRFNHIEQGARERGVAVSDLKIDEMEALWQEAKNLK